MSWVQDLASFAKRLLTLEAQVSANSEKIKRMRQDLDKLRDLTYEIGYKTRQNQDQADSRHQNLVLSLENELLKFEQRLNALPSDDSDDSKLNSD